MTIPPKYEDVVEQLDAALAREDALQALSVTRIMLDVVPGEDGMGEEIYAKSVADVEALLSKQCEDIEALQDREAALREELDQARATGKSYMEMSEELQQRLTVAEQLLNRSQEFVALVHKCCRKNKEYAPLHWQEMVELDRDLSALKPAEEGEGS